MCRLAHRLLWTLLLVAPWDEFRLQYHDFTVIKDPWVDGERFHILGASAVLHEVVVERGARVEGCFL